MRLIKCFVVLLLNFPLRPSTWIKHQHQPHSQINNTVLCEQFSFSIDNLQVNIQQNRNDTLSLSITFQYTFSIYIEISKARHDIQQWLLTYPSLNQDYWETVNRKLCTYLFDSYNDFLVGIVCMLTVYPQYHNPSFSLENGFIYGNLERVSKVAVLKHTNFCFHV